MEYIDAYTYTVDCLSCSISLKEQGNLWHRENLKMRQTVTLNDRLRRILESFWKAGKTPQAIAKRAQILLALHQGDSAKRVSERVGKTRSTVYNWLGRWQEKVPELIRLQEADVAEDVLAEKVVETLSDAPRSGAPPTYSVEQTTQIIALACEPPKESGRAISHWTVRELADEAKKRGIAEISAGGVGHILREADLKPHRMRYWLNAKVEDRDAFDKEVREICQLYEQTPALSEQGVHVVSVDEKTGIQALERCHPDHPVRPGKPALVEYEYIRRGTQCLIASFDVATGNVLGSVVSKRGEVEFLAHIRRSIDTDPEAGWIFVVDQLNTHNSESLVRLVDEVCGLSEDLGKKGLRGSSGTDTREPSTSVTLDTASGLSTPRNTPPG
jgi:transposase